MSKIPPFAITDDCHVGNIGYGLLAHTWTPRKTSDEQAFAAILAALEGGSTFLNAGEFYGSGSPERPEETYANLALLKRFFDKFPAWAEPGKCFLSVKGGIHIENGRMGGPDGSEEGLRRSVNNINARLGGRKKMDLFEMARVDQTRPIEDAIKVLKTLVAEGKMAHIGLSEVSAATIRRAHAVHPIAAVEVEYSMWALDIEQNGVLATCQELHVPIVAYSPLGHGILTGNIKSLADIPEGDMRRMLDRFQPGNFEHNLKLVRKIEAIAQAKGCTTTQLALAWVLRHAGVLPIPGSSRVAGVKECLAAARLTLTTRELADIQAAVQEADIKGLRYNAAMEAQLAV